MVFVICRLLYQLLKIYLMYRTGSEFLYTYVIISSSLIPYQNFGPDLCLDCLLMLSVVLPPVVIDDQRDRQFQNRPLVFYQVARVVSPSLSAVCRNIIFNNVHII